MPEEIKTVGTLGEVDIRRKMIVLIDKDGNSRSITFQDHEARVADIRIPAGVPEGVRDHLVTAKNLLLYSWFYYPFSMTASLQAATGLEKALKIALKAKRRDTLTYLLKRAIRERRLTDAG